MGYLPTEGTNHFFGRFTDNNWEFLAGLLGERSALEHNYAIMRGDRLRSSFEELSLVRANRLIHYSLLESEYNIGKFIHL